MTRGLAVGCSTLLAMWLFVPVTFTHSTLAQTFLCLVAWWAYAGSAEGLYGPGATPGRPVTVAAATRAFRAARWAVAAVFVQLLLGVLVRHTESGLAVPFFPVSSRGEWLPEFVNASVVIHMLHRGFAVVAAALVLRAAWVAVRELHHLAGHALLVTGIVVAQVFLGGAVVWTQKSPTLTSVHVVTGASLLMLCWLLLLRSRRARVAAGSGS